LIYKWHKVKGREAWFYQEIMLVEELELQTWFWVAESGMLGQLFVCIN